MLRNFNDLKGYRLGARDGEIGSLKDFYFDDRHWTARYWIADTGYWLTGRLVLISPHSLQRVRDDEKQIETSLTREQIENSPPISAHEPVSRQYELEYYKYYGWPVYWAGPAVWGHGPHPLYNSPPSNSVPPPVQTDTPPESSHLRSAYEVTGYAIAAADGDLGHVADFVLDETDWSIRYLVVDTRNWLPGKHVLISPSWARDIEWQRAAVQVDLRKEQIQDAPAYNPAVPIDRAYEERLHSHYGRAGYWPAQPTARA
jgi:hypothetical protein